MSKSLVILGLTLVAIGLAWPWILRLGLGRLPGDFVIDREGFKFYFPLATCLLISVVASALFWLLRR